VVSLRNNKRKRGRSRKINNENNLLETKLVILLSEKFTDYICDKTQVNRAVGRPSKFNLEHNGKTVIAIHDFSIT
jgi:hypothetical protein